MSLPPHMRRAQHKIGSAGRRSEKRLEKDFGVKGRPASGAMEGAKGDIDLGAVLMEAKSTTQESLALKLAWLLKIAHEARSEGKSPALSVSFINEDGKPLLDGEWCLIPMHRFKELITWWA